MRSFKIYGIWPQASTYVCTLTHFHNAVRLVWGSLRLAPIIRDVTKGWLTNGFIREILAVSRNSTMGDIISELSTAFHSSQLPPCTIQEYIHRSSLMNELTPWVAIISAWKQSVFLRSKLMDLLNTHLQFHIHSL